MNLPTIRFLQNICKRIILRNKTQFMKKPALLLIGLYVLISAVSCKKNETTTNNNNNNNTPGCADGNVCYKLNGTGVSKPGSGYAFADTFLFVKYEEGAKQLSIDIFGSNTGNYTISDKRRVGNARVYYFPENNVMYMASKGSLNVSAYSTSDKKLSGTFSGTLYKYDSNTETYTYTDSLVMTEGFFTKVTLQ